MTYQPKTWALPSLLKNFINLCGKTLFSSCIFFLSFNSIYSQEFTEVARIIAPDGKMYNNFGFTTGIDGDYAVTGTYRNGTDENGENDIYWAGAAYFMKKDASGSWNIVQKVVASDRAREDKFGASTAISGRYAMFGAPNEDGSFHDDGTVYVFWRNDDDEWVEVQKLIVPLSAGQFGFPIYMEGNRALISARQKTIYYKDENNVSQFHKNAGGAYIFDLMPNGTWALSATLDYSEPHVADNFGKGLHFFGDYAVIGCPKKTYYNEANRKYESMGAIYIFKKQPNGTWLEIKKITPSLITSDLLFGESVVMNDQYIMVGANRQSLKDETGYTLPNAGIVYIYKKKDNEDDWEEDQIIHAETPLQNAYFGEDVQVKGNTLIVGAPNTTYCKDNICYGGGAVYIFAKEVATGLWQQKQLVHGSSVSDFNGFGSSSSFDGNTLIVGAMDHANAEHNIARIGAAFIFEPSTLKLEEYTSSSNLLIYPNPTSSHFYLNLGSKAKNNVTIEVYDTLGKLISRIQPSAGESVIEIETNLANGIYFVKVDLEGDIVFKRIVKQ